MTATTLILVLLATFNLTVLVMKIWGDRFPQPRARTLHADWLQGWRNTQKPLNRFWLQFAITFVIMLIFNATGEMLVGFLVFLRILVFCAGFRRVKQQMAEPSGSVAAITPLAQSGAFEAGTGSAGAASLSAPPTNRIVRKNQLILGGVVIVCAIAALFGFLHSRESAEPSAAETQQEEALLKSMSEPVTLSEQASADQQQANAAPVTSEQGAKTTQEPATAMAAAPLQAQAPEATITTRPAAEPDNAPPQAFPAARLEPKQPTTLSGDTYGNVVASFFPGEKAEDAMMDALGKVNSSLSVDSIDYMGYPAYSLECEKDGQCVNGTGTPFGSVADVAREMFPVNPADVERFGLKCNVVCYDSQGLIIGRAP